MKICQQHWNELKTALDERGLTKFIAPDSKSVINEMVKELKHEPVKFEPLLAANFAIWRNAIDGGGLYLMYGDLCPLCELEAHTTVQASNWINHAADDQYNKAKELGLISEH